MSTLVVTVAGDGSQRFVARNVRAQPSLDFGVVLYSGITDDWVAVQSVAEATGNHFWLKKGKKPTGIDRQNHGFIPKLWFQSQASEWVREGGYEYVWMVDEDIAFHGNFDYSAFWRRHQHEFPDGPPLVSQPTIRQNSQSGRFLFNANMYPCETRLAVTTQVEQQTPLFDAKFWLWLETRLTSLKLKQVEFGSDWITDQTWCNAAARYDPKRTACGIITTPIDHADERTIGWDADKKTMRSFTQMGLDLIDWACSSMAPVDSAGSRTLLPADPARGELGKGDEWLAFFREYSFPPKATLFVPPLPEVAFGRFAVRNEKEGTLGPFCSHESSCSRVMPACLKNASLVTTMYATRAEQVAALADMRDGSLGRHNASL